MAIITDPDQLNQNTEVTFNTSTQRISLTVAGNLSNDGVTLKALYSFAKEEWKTDSSLIRFPFPFTPITDEQFELKDGWDFADNTSRYLIRTGGWAVVDTNGVTQQEWAGIISLGALESGTQPYFVQSAGTPVNFQRTGAVNQAVQIFQNGGTNDRGTFKMFARKRAAKFAQSSLSDIGVSGNMTFQVYRFPLATTPDPKITLTDNQLQQSPYSGITITFHSSPITRAIGGVNYQFNVEIDGNGQTATNIYQTLQYRLRLSSDIDAGSGTQVGKVVDELASFLGETLKLSEGIFLTNFAAADTNNIVHNPNGSAVDISFPFSANLTVEFGDNLKNDTAAVFRVFFTNDDAGDNTGRDFGTSNAITVKDSSNTDIAGSVGGVSSATFTFDYDGNVQRGNASAGDDAPITAVAIGEATGQYVSATGTIARSSSNVISLIAAFERNYENP